MHTHQIKLMHGAILVPLEKHSKRVKFSVVGHHHLLQLMLFPRCTNDQILSHKMEGGLWSKTEEKMRVNNYRTTKLTVQCSTVIAIGIYIYYLTIW